MRRVVDHPVCGRDATQRLLQVRQGSRSVAEMAVQFRTLAAEAGWNDTALQGAFRQALSEELKDQLSTWEESNSLNSLINLAIAIDNRLRTRAREREESLTNSILHASRWSSTFPRQGVVPSEEEPCSWVRSLWTPRSVNDDSRPDPVFIVANQVTLLPVRPYDCCINLLAGAKLPSGRLYSLSGPVKMAMETYIHESLASGIIRPSSSPVGAGFFFVAKKDGSLRPSIDYRGLNEVTIRNKYPLPLINSAFEPLNQAVIFSKLDLRNAYHLVRIREGDEWKTAFNTSLGHYEYLVVPFGLTNAPAVFQVMVNDVLRDLLGRFVFVYIDDILIFSKTPQEHVLHVREVLQRLLENQLFVKAEKCSFHTSSVPFLSFIIMEGRIRADPTKVKAVTEWPQPSTRKHLQQFLGFANFYHRLIRNYSITAALLTKLTSTSIPYCWNPEAQHAFEQLKARFSTAPILCHPDPTRQFTVEVDASDTGVGAILSQRAALDNKLHPCAFFSRRLTPAERNYDVGDREVLAIKLALEEWRHWLEGAGNPFIVLMDHHNLLYIKSAKRLNARRARWSLFFTRFNFSVTFRPGSRNIKVDALSRMFSPLSSPADPEPILPASCVVAAVSWEIE
ncbi:hypothetical protein SKAU_G00223150 [Synaphobranchus kaupii]|uniref:ribonuclease H n=1 Tax=Synaphobranchus kaupii TaxID=118154 RepID=A0A9Q1FBQ2_SYNKA|nr:hypothetical protein SKAU_G00223150 [Synaphobranchus kaupii]